MRGIRFAEKKDIKKIAEFLKIVDKEFVPPLSERGDINDRVRKEFSEGRYLVYEEDNNVVGILCFFDKWKKERCGYISILAVHPKMRGRGIGSKLIEYAICRLKEKGVKDVYTRTWSTNKVGLRFYKRLGFMNDGIIINDRSKGIHTVYLKKFLIL